MPNISILYEDALEPADVQGTPRAWRLCLVWPRDPDRGWRASVLAEALRQCALPEDEITYVGPSLTEHGRVRVGPGQEVTTVLPLVSGPEAAAVFRSGFPTNQTAFVVVGSASAVRSYVYSEFVKDDECNQTNEMRLIDRVTLIASHDWDDGAWWLMSRRIDCTGLREVLAVAAVAAGGQVRG